MHIDGQTRVCRFCINPALCLLSLIELTSPEKSEKGKIFLAYFLLITHTWSPFNIAVAYGIKKYWNNLLEKVLDKLMCEIWKTGSNGLVESCNEWKYKECIFYFI